VIFLATDLAEQFQSKEINYLQIKTIMFSDYGMYVYVLLL